MTVFPSGANVIPTELQLLQYQKILRLFVLMADVMRLGISFVTAFRTYLLIYFSGVMLSCGVHPCPSKCHQLCDHSKMKCEEVMRSMCQGSHSQSFVCGDGLPTSCIKCEREKKLATRKQKEELEEAQRLEAEQRDHSKRMDKLDAEIAAALRKKEEARLARERGLAIQQKEHDLASILASCSPAGATSDVGNTNGLGSVSSSFQAPQNAQLPHIPQPKNNSVSTLDNLDHYPLDGQNTTATAPQHDPNSNDNNTHLPPSIPKSVFKPFPTLPISQSKLEWEQKKTLLGVTNQAVDAIMNLTGLESVKAQILEIMVKIDTATRQNTSLKQERFNAVFLGNPGTGQHRFFYRSFSSHPSAIGKTTVARHYAQFLTSVKVTPGATFSETTGARLAHEGVDGAKNLLNGIIKSGGGTIFIDEAYQLTSGHNSQGPAVLDFLLAEMENNIGTLVFLLAGYNKEMEKFFEHNPGLKSRVPLTLQFADYKDEELMAIFEGLLLKTFGNRMRAQDGTQGLYSRIMIRRLGRRRGQSGFGNARDLQVVFARIRGRQAKRLAAARQKGTFVDDFYLTGEDIIGPDPSKVIMDSKAWKDLQQLIGLESVKESVKSLINLIDENYNRELVEKEPIAVSLNRVFLGSPGTGKTTVAKLYGQVLTDLGLLSNGEGQ